ncbi:MAG: S8 family serine peptidase [Planctomycetota bacterium]
MKSSTEPNYEVKVLQTIPNDTRFGDLWGMHNTGQFGGTPDADIDAPEAWDITTGDSQVVVAVIDTGVDYTHEDLAANMWVNEAELNGTPGFDDDGNGYVDDIYGYDFYNNDGDPMDDHVHPWKGAIYHGTHCSGTIGAEGNNNKGVAGVCWSVRIMALKFLNALGGGWTDDAIEAIEYSVLMGANLSSNSWGGVTYDQGLKDAIDAAGAAGMLFVAAAGNDNENNDEVPHYPSSYDCESLIAVMSTDPSDSKSWFSNWGAVSVDLAAPGTHILSCKKPNDYQYLSGTSMAAPHVAGACALMWARNPDLGHSEVKAILLDTVDELPALDGLCVTGGRLNLHTAVLYAEFTFTKEDDLPPGVSLMPGDYVTYTITYGSRITNPADPGYIGDLSDVYIIDYLPPGIDPCDVTTSDGGVYDSVTNTVTWYIPTLSPAEQLYSEWVRVKITNEVGPVPIITNLAVLEHETFRRTATKKRCFGGDVIYVNQAAAGSNNGVSWTHALTNLQSALARAAEGCGSQIWVAAGTYKPTSDPNERSAAFELVDGVPVYGGFAGTEENLDQRDWVNNETVLSGDIDGDDNWDVGRVVRVSGVNQATIDGFTITKGGFAGVTLLDGSLSMANNIIDGWDYGIEAGGGGTLQVAASSIRAANMSGVHCDELSHLSLTYCKITGGYYGIFCAICPEPSSIIRNNSLCGSGNTGIHVNFKEPGEELFIANTTIADKGTGSSGSYGISTWVESGASGCVHVDNCIVWGYEYSGFDPEPGVTYDVTYSCIQDPEYVGDPEVTGNICTDPLFENADPEDCHLAPNSPCIDAGDPNGDYTGQEDIEGQPRVMAGRVDMGADEFCGIFNLDQELWYDSIQDAIDEAAANETIEVGPGRYYETIDFDSNAVTLRSVHPNEWDVVGATIIDANGSGTVVTFDSNEDANSLLTGFTITGGDSGSDGSGGGIYCYQSSPTIRNCIITGNSAGYGGGIENEKSSPTITSCVFCGNAADWCGGGMDNYDGSSPKVTNCLFYDNTALPWGQGGAIFNASSPPATLTNCTLYGNSTCWGGGGICNYDASPLVTNCILWDNSSTYYGDEVDNIGSSDPNFRHCDIEGCGGSSNWDPNFGTDGGGNKDDDPDFESPSDPNGLDDTWGTCDDGLRIKFTSPCKDTGYNGAVPQGVDTDIKGSDRIINDYVDMGAYEYDPDC